MVRHDLATGFGNTVARFGGDEFAILLEHIGSTEVATRIAKRIQEALAIPFSLQGQQIFSSASIGIALGDKRYQQVEDMLRDADIAMYRAKSKGKAQHALFDADMHHFVRSRLSLETDLRQALERQEFRLVYQPVLALGNGDIVGFEALLRWQHPSRGRLTPIDFIEVAEETGLIIPLGFWVFEEAARQLKTWHDQFPEKGHLKMNINLSSKQLAQLDLASQLQDSLKNLDLSPVSINLEVTESMMLDNASAAVKLLEQLRELGICIQLDDFGMGYSSLSRLHNLPLDTLKIDRSFISSLGHKGGSAGIIEAIITLGHTLGLSIVAEGIETTDQLRQLEQLKCNFGQGYLFSAPREPEEITGMLHDSLVLKPNLGFIQMS
jgi:predicted signal transduction protein with EAL and GGDEF domain